jgi:hypothetical protein
MANIVLSKNTRIALAAGLVALVALGFWWNSLLAKMASAAQAQLVAKANEHVNGKVTVGKVEFSIFGTLKVADVTVTDGQNAVVGKSGLVAVRFGVGDVLAGRADLSAVRSVTLENAAITLASAMPSALTGDLNRPTRTGRILSGSEAFRHGTVACESGRRRAEGWRR